jgi:hypothetical protein
VLATFETVHLVFKEPHALSRGVVVFLLRVPARESGGGDGTRTHDRLVANQVLYQLSYAPRVPAWSPRARGGRRDPARADIMVGLSGLEPLTSRLSGGRSNQLSYRPEQAHRPYRPPVIS